MINKALIQPESIVVVGASENTSKPGGKVLENLLHGGFMGEIYALNPKPVNIEGVMHKKKLSEVPPCDLAVLAVPAEVCIEAAEYLSDRGTRGFIVFSAGFGEAGPEGAKREKRLVEIMKRSNASLIGPNCVGVINKSYKGVFTSPVPDYDPEGCELISSSGATAVFIMEAAGFTGLRFSNVYSIGNAADVGVEDLLEHMDETFNPGESPRVKLLYLEQIKNPFKFLKHSASLIRKGCRIAAIKSGYSEAGGRAASSHTGAMATSDTLVRALFKKAGIVYCSGREELISVACVWQNKELKGKNIAVITHAGGSAVMLTDTLTSQGMEVPSIPEEKGNELLKKLNPGSSAGNPIDFLATGTAEQLDLIIDFCEQLSEIDGMIVVFGSPGLFNVREAYDVLHAKQAQCSKPVYPVLPSLINAEKEIREFVDKGNTTFPDEVVLGNALAHAFLIPPPSFGDHGLADMDHARIRDIIYEAENGYLPARQTRQMLRAAGIHTVKEKTCRTVEEAEKACEEISFPVAAKIVGPIHKTDVGGVSLNINSKALLRDEFKRLMNIKGASGVLIQEMTIGEELYCGAVKKQNYGHLVLCGLGGIFVEILRDVSYGLAPLNAGEVTKMIRSLKGYPVIRGYRKRKGVDEFKFIDAVVRISSLVYMAPEIAELDINPFIGNEDHVVAVDARINIQKPN